MSDSNMVKSPKHYAGLLAEQLGIEVIDIANALNLNGNRFSILRYVLRAGLKDPTREIEDLEKIVEYAQFEIRRLKREPVSHTRRNTSLKLPMGTRTITTEPLGVRLNVTEEDPQ